MSLFGTKKKIYVASSVNKIIDDSIPRASFMQEALVSSILTSNPRDSVSRLVLDAHLKGPRNRLRNAFTWAKTYYDYAMPSARIEYNDAIDNDVVAAEILSDIYDDDPNTSISVSEVFIDTADESYFGEQYVYANRPELANDDWAVDYVPELGQIWVQYPDGTVYPPETNEILSSEALPGTPLNPGDRILVAYYQRTEGSTTYPSQVFIYPIGSGNAVLDSFSYTVVLGGSKEFYPVIPIRIDNVAVFDEGSPALPKEADIRKAYKKAFGGNIDEFIDEINNNDSIDDIDYAYLVFGCSLNTKSAWEKQYIFSFMQFIGNNQATTPLAFEQYKLDNDALKDPVTGVSTSSRNVPLNTFRLTMPGSEFVGSYDVTISWANIAQTVHTGTVAPDAKLREVTLEAGASYTTQVNQGFFNGASVRTRTIEDIVLKQQITETEYIQLVVSGLHYKNLIYEGKSVDINAGEALLDDEPSGFVIPLHEPTLKSMGLVRATEISRESYLVVFNSYQVVKQKWYQTGIFKAILTIVVVVVVAIISVLTAGAGTGPAAASGMGLLGTAAGVGAFLGFQGLLAVAIGAAVNAIAAMIVVRLVAAVATELFGEQIGQIIATITAMAISLGAGPGGFSVNNFSTNLANIASIDKIAALTIVTADIFSIVYQNNIEDLQVKMADLKDDYEEELDRLKQQWETFGFGDNVFDPLMLTDYSDPTLQMGHGFVPSGFSGETLDQFIGRTLMSGSDMIELSQSMVSDFVDATLTLP